MPLSGSAVTELSGGYFYPQMNRASQNPRSLTTPVSSSTIELSASAGSGVAISGSAVGGARYQFQPSGDCYMRFVLQGSDPEATDQDTFMAASAGPYIFTAPVVSDGISVLPSGSVLGFVSITQLG